MESSRHCPDLHSHPNFLEQMDTVKSTLTDLNSIDKPSITVFNKIDAFKSTFDENDLKSNGHISLKEFKSWWLEKENSPCVFISVTKKKNLEELKDLLYNNTRAKHLEIYPHQLLY